MKAFFFRGVSTLLIASGVLFSTFSSHAQGRIKAVGGVNFSTLGEYDPQLSFHVGAMYQQPLNHFLFLEAGLVFQQARMKNDIRYLAMAGNEEAIVLEEYRAKAYFWQLPVHVGVTLPLSNSFSLLLDAGPYVAFGMDGTIKGDKYVLSQYGAHAEHTEIKADYFSKDTFRRFYGGLGGKISLEYKQKVGVYAGYDFDLTNGTKGYKNKRNTLSVGVSYKF